MNRKTLRKNKRETREREEEGGRMRGEGKEFEKL